MDNFPAAGNDKLIPEDFQGSSVREVHIDFLLEEEFNVDPNFLLNFIEAAGQRDTSIQVERVEHSVSDQCGEADLIVVYKQLAGARERIAILIEDKIRAGFQPRQADRYRERGEMGKNCEWNRYWTCLVAPASYLKSKPVHGFDAEVKLEQIKEWLAVSEPSRREFKVRVIEQAIEKANRTGIQKVDPAMTVFRERYFAFCGEFFTDQCHDIQPDLPRQAWWGDVWFWFRRGLLQKGVYICHKSQLGFVDLTFPNTDAKRLMEIEAILESGMTIQQTGKSAAVRLVVPKIDIPFNDFEQERAKVAEALIAVGRLLTFYGRERARLEQILTSTPPLPTIGA